MVTANAAGTRSAPAGSDADTLATVRAAVAAVPDPELPVLTIGDLGILRSVSVAAGRAIVTITPTYSGCPAMAAIRRDIAEVLTDLGVSDVDIRVVLDPPWTTDWLTPAARRKLVAAGIAPPTGARRPAPEGVVDLALTVRCTRCGSPDTEELSRFGSTACKSLWRCRSCGEPFDRFKEH
jgi:ring-1,2-phenylacetyl-CoA epoxidase subunit PaaD